MPSAYRICVIPGDGIGKEVIPQAARALRAAAAGHGFDVELDEQPWGSDYYLRTGRMMPPDGHEVVAAADATLFGAVGSPEVPDSVSAWGLVLSTRQRLDLYVNLRPIRGPRRAAGNPDLDLVVVRENTEGEYAGVGGRLHRGTPRETATQVSVFTRQGIERIVDYAFNQVRPGGLLTSVTKSNALPHTMGLWEDVTAAVAERHPGVAWERMHVDAVAYQLVRAAARFDVLVASNLFGDILSDLGAGLQGSLGLAASGNLNPERRIGIFEPVHGSAPDIAGKGVANPAGAINSAAMLLRFLGEQGAAASIERAVSGALAAGAVTPDLGGACGTSEVGDEVVRRLQAGVGGASGTGG
jgi:tartrate dehydrogenase/decarboxylase / D-malate dehydrogenase